MQGTERQHAWVPRGGRAALAALLLLTLAACGAAAPAARHPGLLAPGVTLEPERTGADRPLREEEILGKATWYGERHHGRTTANGESFDMEAFTAAHRSLPFNTIVRVIEEETRRSVVVRINDRGPFKSGLIIDLAKAAAAELGMLERGVSHVQLEVLVWGDGARYIDGKKVLPRKKRASK